MDERALQGILGLALKAGQLTKGAEQSVQLVRDKKAALMLLDAQASENTQKRVQDACKYYNVPVIVLKPRLMAQACGQAEMAAGALRAGHFANKVRQIASLEYDSNLNETKIAEDLG